MPICAEHVVNKCASNRDGTYGEDGGADVWYRFGLFLLCASSEGAQDPPEIVTDLFISGGDS